MNNSHADILIITATEIETISVIKAFNPDCLKNLGRISIGTKTYINLGFYTGSSVFLVQTEMGSIGPGSSTLTATEGIKSLSPRAIIMVGIAFGINPKKQKIGDVLVSTQLLVYEKQRMGTNELLEPKVIIRGDRAHASTRLIDRFRSGELDWDKCRIRFGLLLSGEKLVDNEGFRISLQGFEPEAIGGEMEGAGLYSAAHQYNVDWLIVKGICDWADGKKFRNKSKRQAIAAQNASIFTYHVIMQGGFGKSNVTLPDELLAPIKADALAANKNLSGLIGPEKSNEQIVTLYMGGDYLDSYISSDLLLRKSLDTGDLENATLFLSAMVNIRRLQGKFKEALDLYNYYSEIIPYSTLPPQYYLRVLKEKLVIAHETDQLDQAFYILREIDRVDNSRTICPPGDNWLPGVILWREAHLMHIKGESKPQKVLNRSLLSIDWYRSIQSNNTSGLASAYLNTGWLYYIYGRESCVEYFKLAQNNSCNFSPRIYAEAKIAESIANFKINPQKWTGAAISLIIGLKELELEGSKSRNYSFLGAEKSPLNIFKKEFAQNSEKAFETLVYVIENKLLPRDDLRSASFFSLIDSSDRKGELIRTIKKEYS